MLLAKVTFGVRKRNAKQELESVAEGYLGSLSQAGQLSGEYFLTWTEGSLHSYVLLAGPGAFKLRYHSAHGKKDLYTVTEAFGRRPAWKVLDDEARQRPSSWKGAPFLYLCTAALDRESPVCRGDGKAPIPMFLLPISFERKYELYSWQRSYYHHDNIWLGSGALEIAAYRQLADPNSELAREGRELCRAIETAVEIPTFYYLERYWGRSRGEDQRRCPGCGAQWKTIREAKGPESFWDFDFRCDPCRFVSHFGVSTDGGRYTRIGEFNVRGRKGNQTVRGT